MTGEEGFGELIERQRAMLQKVARAYCPRPDERRDLLQEMVIALWRSFDRYNPARTFSTWAYRIALNVAISFYRREERHERRRVTLDELPPADNVPEDPRVAELLECIEELDPLDKALVLLNLDGHSHAETADILGISETNSATKLGRIKDRLRRAVTAAVAREERYGTR